jgi:hypothetical protein
MKKYSNKASRRPIQDFQIFKGVTETTMKPFGSPVMAHHEARLLVKNDQQKLADGIPVMYAIYKRSENRILQILRTPEAASLKLAA